MKKFWIFAGLLIILAGGVWGQTTYTWTGAVDANWGTPGNWTPAGVPGNNDIAIIQGGAPNYPSTPQLYNTSITITGGTLNITNDAQINHLVISGGTVSVQGWFKISSLEMSGGELTFESDSGWSSVISSSNITGGKIGFDDFPSDITFGGNVNHFNDLEINGGSPNTGGNNITVDGEFNGPPEWETNGTITGGGSGTPGGTYTWTGNVSNAWNNPGNWTPSNGGSGYPGITDNTSVIIIPGTYTNPLILNVNVSCDTISIANPAVVDLQGFTLTAADSITNNGTIKLHGTNNQVTVNGAAPSAGTNGTIHYYNAAPSPGNWVFGNTYNNLIVEDKTAMASTAFLTVNGTATIGANITTTATQTYNALTLSNNITFSGPSIIVNGNFTQTAGSLTITNPAGLTKNGGTMQANNINGFVTMNGNITANGDINITGNVTLDGTLGLGTNNFSAANLTINAAGTLTGGANSTINLTGLNINGGTLTAGANSKISLTGGIWTNTGTFTPGTGTVEFNNNATVNSNNTFNNVTSAGTVSFADSNTINAFTINGGTVTFSGENEIDDLTVNGAAVNFAGGLTHTIKKLTTTGTTTLTSSGAGSWELDGLTALNFSSTSSTTISWCDSNNYLGRVDFNVDPINGNAIDGGNNTDVFDMVNPSGGTFVWTGNAGNNNWNDNGNWNILVYPHNASDTKITIPQTAYQPRLNVNVQCGDLIIEAGAELDLQSHTLAAISIDNKGTIKLYGTPNQVTVSGAATAGPVSTIHYYNTAGNSWVFGETYNNLIIENKTAMASTASLTVNGTATLSSNITTTTGFQTYNGAVVLTNNVNFTGNAGTPIHFQSTITGNTQTGEAPARQLTVSNADVQFDGAVGANDSISGININSAGSVTISASGSLTSAGNISIITSASAGGDVTINGTLSSAGNASEGAASAVYIRADKFGGNGNINLSGAGAVCANITSEVTYSGAVTGNRIHYHTNGAGRHIVYRTGADLGAYSNIGGDSDAIPANSYLYIQADANLGADLTFSTTGNGNIYIIDVGSAANANARAVTFNSGGYIEIRGAYTSSGTLTLNPANNSVRLVNGEALTTPAALNLPSFTLGAGVGLNLRSANSIAQITTNGASGITLRTITGTNNEANHLTLNSGAGNPINFTGAAGTAALRLGDIEVTNGDVTFSALVYANSYTQNNGSAVINAAQTYTDAFTQSSTGDITFNGTVSITTANGDISFSGHLFVSGNTTLTAGSNKIALGIASDVDLTTAGSILRFVSEAALPASALLTTFTASSGGRVEFNQGAVNPAQLRFTGGAVPTAALNIGQGSGTLYDITITSGTYVSVIGGMVINQTNTNTLAIEGGAVLDTSAGSWYMGTSGASADRIFYGVSGTVTLSTDSNLIANHLTLESPFKSTNTGEAAVSAKGHVNIENTTFGNTADNTNFPLLILEMAGSGGQNLTVYTQDVPRLHVKSGSRTTLTGDLSVRSEVQITYPGVLNAGSNDVTLKAGLTASKGRVGRWEVIGAPQYIASGEAGYSNGGARSMHAFVQNDTNKVTFGVPGDTNVYFEILGNTVWQTFECEAAGAVIEFSRHPTQHVFLYTLSVRSPSPTNQIKLTRYVDDPAAAGWINIYDSTRDDPPPQPAAPGQPPDPSSQGLPFYHPSSNLKSEHQSEKEKFWNINLIPPGNHHHVMDMDFVSVYFSHAWYQTIPVPEAAVPPRPDDKTISALPFYRPADGSSPKTGYFCYDWIRVKKIIYSFVEDSTGNGRVDRIRVQTTLGLNGDFSDYHVAVEGYEIDRDRPTKGGYPGFDVVYDVLSSPQSDDEASFYIYLKEKPYLYDGQPITWRVTANNKSLMDALSETQLIGGENPNEIYWTINTIPPRISYALALPNHNQVYVRMSQPVAFYDTSLVPNSYFNDTNSDINSHDGLITDVSNPERQSHPPYRHALEYRPKTSVEREGTLYQGYVPGFGYLSYLLEFPNEFDISALAALPQVGAAPSLWFMLGQLRDMGVRAMDWRDEAVAGGDYVYYKSPRYPKDWGYSAYDYYIGNGHIESLSPAPSADILPDVTNANVFVPPNRVLTPQMVQSLENGNGSAVMPSNFTSINNSGQRRVTDVLVSRPPSDAEGSDEYFAWPIWASYDNKQPDDPPVLTPDDIFWRQQGTDMGIIWEFDGTKYLEEKDNIVLQAKVNPLLSGNLQLFFSTNVPVRINNEVLRSPEERSGRNTGGLWLPLIGPKPYFYIVPQFTPAAYYTQHPSPVQTGSLFNYDFNNSDPSLEISSGQKLEFLFHLSSSSDQNLYIARLDVKPGAGVPNEWWKRVRPFSFEIHNVVPQRGGVSILNNVINSENRERTYIRYHLVRPGRVTIQVYTLEGALVYSIRRNEYRESGEYTDPWDGTNNAGRPVARGMYFVRIVAPDIDEIRQVMVIK